jgi:hypothetical protein
MAFNYVAVALHNLYYNKYAFILDVEYTFLVLFTYM